MKRCTAARCASRSSWPCTRLSRSRKRASDAAMRSTAASRGRAATGLGPGAEPGVHRVGRPGVHAISGECVLAKTESWKPQPCTKPPRCATSAKAWVEQSRDASTRRAARARSCACEPPTGGCCSLGRVAVGEDDARRRIDLDAPRRSTSTPLLCRMRHPPADRRRRISRIPAPTRPPTARCR